MATCLGACVYIVHVYEHIAISITAFQQWTLTKMMCISIFMYFFIGHVAYDPSSIIKYFVLL